MRLEVIDLGCPASVQEMVVVIFLLLGSGVPQLTWEPVLASLQMGEIWIRRSNLASSWGGVGGTGIRVQFVWGSIEAREYVPGGKLSQLARKILYEASKPS